MRTEPMPAPRNGCHEATPSPGHVTGRGFAEERGSRCSQGKMRTREGISSAALPNLLPPWISRWRSSMP